MSLELCNKTHYIPIQSFPQRHSELQNAKSRRCFRNASAFICLTVQNRDWGVRFGSSVCIRAEPHQAQACESGQSLASLECAGMEAEEPFPALPACWPRRPLCLCSLGAPLFPGRARLLGLLLLFSHPPRCLPRRVS